MSCVLLLDVGGTFLKGALVSTTDLSVISTIRRAGPALKLTNDGEATLDALDLRVQVVELARELAAACDADLAGIFVTGQMHGVVLTDHEGQPATNVITWRDSLQCTREGYLVSASQLIRDVIDTSTLASLGNELREGLPISTLVARRSRGQQVHSLVAHSLISYAVSSLVDTKEQVRMHVTDAAAHGFWNIKKGVWDYATLDALGLGGLQLPEVTSEVEPAGWSEEFQCFVYLAVGDQQAALLGVDLAEGELSLNIATGSQVSTLTREPIPNAQIRPYFDGVLLSTYTHIPAGRALNLLVQLVTELCSIEIEDAWLAISKKVADESASDLEIDLGFFPSLIGSSGGISNIHEGNFSVGQVFKAAVHSMAKNYVMFASKIFPLHDYTTVVLSGGLATRFTPLYEAIRNEFGDISYRVSASEDASLEGLRKLSSDVLAT